MARTACVSIYHYFLQIVLLREQTGGDLPRVVVTEDIPGGTVLDANRHARNAGVRPGMRFAAALSLVPRLRAGTVSPEERRRTDRLLQQVLYGLSPEVEPCEHDPGVFWVGARGLGKISSSPAAWGRACHEAVKEVGFHCTVAMGWTRAGTYGAAKSAGAKREVILFTSPREESAALDAAPLTVLPLPHRDRDQFLDLGIDRVGAFRALPRESILRRFGHGTVRVHAFLNTDTELPVNTAEQERDKSFTIVCPYPVQNREHLEPHVDSLLQHTDRELRHHGESVTAMTLELLLENGRVESRGVRPARPTGDTAFLKRLLQLRLTEPVPEMSATNGVVRCILRLETAPVAAHQAVLFPLWARSDTRRRETAGVAAVISRLRALFGDGVVGRFAPRDGFLPEEIALWEPLDGVPPPRGDAGGRERFPGLVRRTFATPSPLAPGADRTAGRVQVIRQAGPFFLTGRWWAEEYRRRYYYLERADGRLLWVYRDAHRSTWMLQGFVE